MKNLFCCTLFTALAITSQAQQYYPLPSPCDPDKVFSLLPNASYDNNCVFHLAIDGKMYNSFPQELFSYPNIQDIALTNCGLNELSINLPFLKELEVLDLSNNNLKSLPATIGECKKLRKLILKNNQLSMLTGNLTNCTNLEEIDITGNPITEFPSVLATLPKLKVIKAGAFKVKNPVAFINSIKNNNITHLDLSNCALNYLPSVIKNFTYLQELNLSNNAIQYLTDDVAMLPSLTKLDLSNNKLDAIPASICNMQQLKMLKLNNNNLKTLPNNFSNLKNINFDISNNIGLDNSTQNMLNETLDEGSSNEIKQVATYRLKSVKAKSARKLKKRKK
jgi:Leucine-rich repeat (LRR) protein